MIKPNWLLRAANIIFDKVGRLVSEEVIVQLRKQNCLPILLYGLEYVLNMRSVHSLNVTVTMSFMKLFQTSNMEIA